jgi:hypothetical protein
MKRPVVFVVIGKEAGAVTLHNRVYGTASQAAAVCNAFNQCESYQAWSFTQCDLIGDPTDVLP